ncbi:ABC transporter ATP-binding protein [Brevibacillus brevis]|uniref:ABC transporter ATP-binding protein n=1 Tax=Brevibacillus brevis TaxID=1393 RepID=UPI0037C5C53B
MTIKVSNLTKRYSKNVTALNEISLSIDKGIFGLLGRNGSGKTTLMRSITTLLEPTEGSIQVLGMKSNQVGCMEIKRNIGYLPQEFGFYKEFTVMEIMQYICILRGIGKENEKKLITEALEKVNMLDDKKKKYRQLSGGMKRRVGLAQAMLGNPPILIVDEPTAGVDPEERIRIRKLLSEYGQTNTVLFSTHIIEDIEYTCDKLAILEQGNLLFDGTLGDLLKMTAGNIFEYTFGSLEAFQYFDSQHTVISFKREGTETKAVFIGREDTIPGSKSYKPTLEDAYVFVTAKGRAGK